MTDDMDASPAATCPSLTRPAILGLFVLLLISLAARLWYSSISPISYDESQILMTGVLINQGYAAYTEVYSEFMPFAQINVQASAILWGASHNVRILMIAYGLMGVVALFYLVYRHARHNSALAALFAATFFSFNPHFFFISTSINLEAGALAWGLLSVAVVEYYRSRSQSARQAIWLLLAGITFGLSTTFKVFVPFVPAIIALQIFLILVVDKSRSPFRFSTYTEFIQLGLIWLAGVLLILIGFLYAFDHSSLIEQVIIGRFALREAITSGTDGVNIAEKLTAADLTQFALLLIGSIVGLYALWRDRLVYAWIWPVWMALAAIFLSNLVPIRPRHIVTALPPLAALSGIGLAYILSRLNHRNQQVARWLSPLMAVTILVLAILAPLLLIETQSFTDKHPVRQAAIDFVKRTTAPDDCIISKENRLHFLSERLSTPYLSLISTSRLFSGMLTDVDIAREASLYECPVIVYADTFDRLIPELRDKLDELYSVRLTMVDPREPDYPLDLYTVIQDNHQQPSRLFDLLLGNQLSLKGYDLTDGPWTAGQTVRLSTYWHTQDQIDTDYKLFIHLRNEQGQLVETYDHYPFTLSPEFPVTSVNLNPAYLENRQTMPKHYPAHGMIPTSYWLPGTTLVETVALSLPVNVTPGEYSLVLGMYDEHTMERLPVTGRGINGNEIALEFVLVE